MIRKYLVHLSIVIILILLYSFESQSSGLQNIKEPTLTVTYIGNEGIMLKFPSKKVLIDALTSHDSPYYVAPSAETLEQMISGSPPFDDVDLILVTHHHIDHFSPASVAECLSRNPETIFLSTRQAIDLLKDQEAFSPKIEPQIKEVTPEVYKSFEGKYNGLDVKVLRLRHSIYLEEKDGKKVNRHENVQNLGFIVKSDGITIFHSGDARADLEEFKKFDFLKDSIDVAFMPFGFFFDSVGVKIIKEWIKPKHLVLIHIGPQYTDRILQAVEARKEMYPNVTAFTESMQTKRYYLK